ncbi:SMI1/KNR4 family protein [Massilia sp. B-10]|nr:SMI1/KNR4 family protein [Massilia sp. B-10]UUZ54165.1 SMI1/KNR4 family protein [Massilia sp. H-1]
MKKFQSALLVAGLAQESDIRGLSEDAIMGIEADRGLTLPTDYKDFLR